MTTEPTTTPLKKATAPKTTRARKTTATAATEADKPTKKASTPKTTRARKAATTAATEKATAAEVIEPTKVSKRREVAAAKAKATSDQVRSIQKTIPRALIDRDPNQPRELFDQQKLDGLTRSMKKLGQLQPITVREESVDGKLTGRYTLVMGERRWRAAEPAGITELTALVLLGDRPRRETFAQAVAENVGRVDMTPLEEAKAFAQLRDDDYEIEEIADMVGKSAAYVGWRIDLLKLCDSAQEALGKGHLSVNLAWYVARLHCDNQRRFLTKWVRGQFKSTRDAEDYVKAVLAEERRQQDHGQIFMLSPEVEGARLTGDQDELPGVTDLPEEQRERILADRGRLTGKFDKLGGAGAILAELATADAEDLALLLAGAAGGVPAYTLRVEHLRDVAVKAIRTLREAQSIASVRAAGALVLNEDAISA
ncbi:ParB/RepB/Spo0J family partition protein [Embleya sp. AB8]|uniref:ParB/RepB/Spo0J family partition protein n=1 Tax=Embleya sp. AB8 TaxID=3156304 RepID=UPI003C725AE5